MESFEEKVKAATRRQLKSSDIETLQVNLGLRCNQRCAHCHVSASPERKESMGARVMLMVLEAAKAARPSLVDLTGGAPELNPLFCWFVDMLVKNGLTMQVRTNLTAMLTQGLTNLPAFLAERRIRLVASMPCYLEENVRAQRGPGVYEKSVEAIKRLNALGYGISPELPLNLVYNPGGAFLPPDQLSLEADYKRELMVRFGVSFTHLLTITNMPIGRFKCSAQYKALLRESFNPATIDGLMCRHQVSVGWDGTLFDCDFNLALSMPVNHGAPDHVRMFDPAKLRIRKVVTGEHCFGCTAGCGSSCKGSLA